MLHAASDSIELEGPPGRHGRVRVPRGAPPDYDSGPVTALVADSIELEAPPGLDGRVRAFCTPRRTNKRRAPERRDARTGMRDAARVTRSTEADSAWRVQATGSGPGGPDLAPGRPGPAGHVHVHPATPESASGCWRSRRLGWSAQPEPVGAQGLRLRVVLLAAEAGGVTPNRT
jgi:hypothetical protein